MPTPDLTVVIPSYNRRKLLDLALPAYDRQETDGFQFEVAVVDDGSTDGTMDLLASCRPRRYRLLSARQENSGPAQARNRAIRMASGHLIVFAGDDIVPSARFLAEHWQAHRRHPSRDFAFIGLTRWPTDQLTTATMRHIDGPGAQQFSFHYFQDGCEYDFRHFYTSNLSVKRELLDCEPTYFSTEFRRAAFEDVELSYRLSLHGMRIFYREAAVGFHHHPYEAPGFFNRQVSCGEMGFVLYEKYPALERWLGLRELDAERLKALREPTTSWRKTAALARRLAEMEDRALRVVSLYERFPEPPRGIDNLLAPLFRYAYLKGLAEACYEEPVARRLCAGLFRRLLGPATAQFVELASADRVPVLWADVEVILHHAT